MSDLRNAITLDATVEREVEQDFITIGFSAIEGGTSPQVVQDALKTRLAEAVAVATPHKKGNAFKVQTGNMSVRPAYNSKGTMTGYTGSVSLIVSGTDMQAVATMTSEIKSMSVSGVELSVSNAKRKKYEDGLAKDAIAAFRAKANMYAEAFGAKGCQLISAVVRVDGGYRAPRVSAMRAVAVSAAPNMPVETGKETLSATVSGQIVLVKD